MSLHRILYHHRIRAEDGRCIQGVDLSPFIHDLPLGITTGMYSFDSRCKHFSGVCDFVFII